jgi:hypothetical protein
MKDVSLLLLFLFTGILNTNAQTDSVCVVKMGSNYYINCQHIITFKKQPVFTIKNSTSNLININFDVFAENGKKIAEIKNGKLVLGLEKMYKITSTENEFSLIEKASNRILCIVKKLYIQEHKRCELHISVDLYMPSGFYFQCTPDDTNVESLKYISGSTFSNSLSVFQFN